MPIYRVRMTRDTSQSIDLEVLAPDPEGALEEAFRICQTDPKLAWTDDDYAGKPYCPDADAIEEIAHV